MEKVPYTPSPKNVKEFFQAIQSLGTPPKVDRAYLPTIGFKSSNDRYLISMVKYLGFIDDSGTPTSTWNDFRDKDKAPKVMASAIKTAYAHLFTTYPDAEKRDNQKLKDYFASKTGSASSVANYMVQTFKYLCEFADFKAVAVTEPISKPPTAIKEIGETPTGVQPLTININIQLQLPATEDATIYDNLFSTLKKHLLS